MSSPTNTQELEDSLWVKWRLPALVAVGILAVLIILYVARGSLLPIIISVIVAELLFPIVSYIEGLLPGHERYPRVARIFTIALVYILFFALVAALLYLTFQPVIKEAQEFIETAPEIYEQAKVTIEGLVEEFNQRVPDEVKAQLDELLQSASGLVSEAALAILAKTLSSITGTISIVIGLVIVPFLLFYMLKDKEELVGGMYSVLPKDVARHTHNVFGRIHGVIGSYVRAQLISAIIVGVFVFLGLLLLDISFALTLGLLAGVFGLIPIIGAFIGAVPGLLVTLATDPGKLLWVALVYIVVQFVESNIISPRIQGRAVRLHPIFIMATLIIASDIAGLWGVLIGVPVVAAARDVFAYFYTEWRNRISSEEALDDPDHDEADPEQGTGPSMHTGNSEDERIHAS